MARKDYPFSRRDSKRGNKLISGLLTGLLLSPILIESAMAKSINYDNISTIDNTWNKKEAMFVLVICIIISPLVYLFIKLGILLSPFPILGIFAFIGLSCIPLLIWIASLYCAIKTFVSKKNSVLEKFEEVRISTNHTQENQNKTTDKKRQLTLCSSVELSPLEVNLCETYINAGRNFNKNIAKKRVHVGSNVLRRSDNKSLIVINKTKESKYICLDLENKQCDLYTRNDLVLS